jgi:hypothetical protein
LREHDQQARECKAEAAMTIPHKTGLILAAIVVALLIVSVFVVPVVLNVDRYRPRVISYLEERSGKKVEIGGLAVTLFPRVTIHVDDFGVKSPRLRPQSYIPQVARIDAELDPWTLLHRQIVARSLVLEAPSAWRIMCQHFELTLEFLTQHHASRGRDVDVAVGHAMRSYRSRLGDSRFRRSAPAIDLRSLSTLVAAARAI